jgi:hypothetical protein
MMKRKLKIFTQNLGHGIEDEDAADAYLEESLPLVGTVVMYFNALEKALDSLICDIVSDRTEEPGLIVLQGMHFAQKVDLFKRFCESLHRAVEEPLAYDKLVDGLLEVAKLRNLVVHADWMSTDEEGFTFVRIKVQKDFLQQEYVQLSADSLERVLERILAVKTQLSDYWEQRSEIR